MRKNPGKQGNPLSNTIKDSSTIMRNPFALKLMYNAHGASLHPHFALVPHIFDGSRKRSYAHAYMPRLARAAL